MFKTVLALTTLILLLETYFFGLHQETSYMNFAQYKKLYNLHFDNKFEETYRETIYNTNVAEIQKYNKQKNRSYEMGINQFTYLTHQEFVDIYLGTKVATPEFPVDDTDNDTNQLDWGILGAVTPVKNQGNCGACWAFSATGALQGLSKIAYNNLQTFSEQQLIDCSFSYGNNGCFGGYMENAFKYVKDNGITTQSLYPYKGVKGTCAFNQGNFKISSYYPALGCAAMTKALTHGPVSVGVDASNWLNYKSGVFSSCGSHNLNHGVLLTGISQDYWRVKNSWGTTWGEKGYIRLSRGNTCGICTQPLFPSK